MSPSWADLLEPPSCLNPQLISLDLPGRQLVSQWLIKSSKWELFDFSVSRPGLMLHLHHRLILFDFHCAVSSSLRWPMCNSHNGLIALRVDCLFDLNRQHSPVQRVVDLKVNMHEFVCKQLSTLTYRGLMVSHQPKENTNNFDCNYTKMQEPVSHLQLLRNANFIRFLTVH